MFFLRDPRASKWNNSPLATGIPEATPKVPRHQNTQCGSVSEPPSAEVIRVPLTPILTFGMTGGWLGCLGSTVEKYEIQVSPSQDNSGKRFSHGKSEAKMKNVILIFPSGLGKHFVILSISKLSTDTLVTLKRLHFGANAEGLGSWKILFFCSDNSDIWENTFQVDWFGQLFNLFSLISLLFLLN